MFHDEIPYATALERGRMQQQVLDHLSGGIESIGQIDWQRAAELVQAKLPTL